MRFESHRILVGAALAWLVSACTVVTTPAPQSPPNEPPPGPPAGSADGYYDSEPASPAPAAPAPAPAEPAYDPGEPVAHAPDSAPPPPPKRRDHRTEQPTPAHSAPEVPPPPKRRDHRTGQPDAAPTTGRPHTRVPIRRGRDRLGRVAEFQIEPTAGPVGTTVNIYGDFRRAMRAGGLAVSFHGTRRAARPIYVAADRIAVVVPRGARTGPVQVTLRKREMWRGSFAVTRQDDDIFVPIDEGNGLLGAVYKLPQNTQRLPDFEALGRPFATIVVPSLRVSPRRFDTGFPGLDAAGETLLEWFGIRFMGMIDVPTSGAYGFRVNSDDGARLYIDNQLVVDNDGVHAPRTREGTINLSAGRHDIVVEYFQGPRFQIALELLWRRGGGWTPVPAEAFVRYTGHDCSSKPEILCCQGNSAQCRQCQRNARQAMQEWTQLCQGGGQPGAGNPHPGNPDCTQPPQRLCCQGNSAQCRQCRRDARQATQEWKQACQGGGQPGAGNPDCTRPPQRLCCQGNSAQCRQCRRDARQATQEWKQACQGGGQPGAGNPGNPDCAQPPGRMCCQSNTPQCRQCRQEAAAERAAWQQQCGNTTPVDNIDCSKSPPRRACCKALTPRCKECQRQARDEQVRWEQQCQRR